MIPDALLARVNKHASDLSPAQKRIVQHLLANPLKASYESIAQIARAAKCSESTVTRLANALGFSGLPEMRQVLQDNVQSQLAPGDRLAEATQKLARDAQSYLDYHHDVDMTNLHYTREGLDARRVDHLADLLMQARKVYVLGHGLNIASAVFMAHRLRRCLINVEELHGDTFANMARLMAISPDDVLVVFDLPRYSKESLLIARHAKAMGVPVVLVTDREETPLTPFSTMVFCAGSQGVAFSSLVGIMFFINVIGARILINRGSATLPAFRQIESLEKQIDHYIEFWDKDSTQS